MKKKEKNAVIKTCLDILPVRSWEPSVGAFLLADSSYLDLLRLVPRDLQNIAEDELELEIYQFTKVLKTVGCDLKFLSMRFPLSLERQKAVLLHHARQAGDETRIRWLERQIRELEVAETNISSQHFYLAYMIFSLCCAVYLVLPSRYNKGRANWESIVVLLRADRAVYRPYAEQEVDDA